MRTTPVLIVSLAVVLLSGAKASALLQRSRPSRSQHVTKGTS
jgi:hypothetical protein